MDRQCSMYDVASEQGYPDRGESMTRSRADSCFSIDLVYNEASCVGVNSLSPRFTHTGLAAPSGTGPRPRAVPYATDVAWRGIAPQPETLQFAVDRQRALRPAATRDADAAMPPGFPACRARVLGISPTTRGQPPIAAPASRRPSQFEVAGMRAVPTSQANLAIVAQTSCRSRDAGRIALPKQFDAVDLAASVEDDDSDDSAMDDFYELPTGGPLGRATDNPADYWSSDDEEPFSDGAAGAKGSRVGGAAREGTQDGAPSALRRHYSAGSWSPTFRSCEEPAAICAMTRKPSRGLERRDDSCNGAFSSLTPASGNQKMAKSLYQQQSEFDTLSPGTNRIAAAHGGKFQEDFITCSSHSLFLGSNQSILGTRDYLLGSMYDAVIPPSPLDTLDLERKLSEEQEHRNIQARCVPWKPRHGSLLTWLFSRVRKLAIHSPSPRADAPKQAPTGSSNFAYRTAATKHGRDLYKRRHAVLLNRIDTLLEENKRHRSHNRGGSSTVSASRKTGLPLDAAFHLGVADRIQQESLATPTWAGSSRGQHFQVK